jgi:hypothetical protein
LSNKISNIRIVAKDKENIIFEGDMGKTVDIVYKTKDPLSHEIVMMASYPNSLIRALGGMAVLLGRPHHTPKIALPDNCGSIDIDILIYSEGSDKPDIPQIECAGCTIIPHEDNKLTYPIPTSAIFIGMDEREAIGAIHLIEFQQLISGGINYFLQKMAEAQAQMMAAQQQARGMGPGGVNLDSLLKKPRH